MEEKTPITESPRTQPVEDPRLHDPAADSTSAPSYRDNEFQTTEVLPVASSDAAQPDKTEPPTLENSTPTTETTVISSPPEQKQTVATTDSGPIQAEVGTGLPESVSSSSDMTPSDSLSEGTVKVEKADVAEAACQPLSDSVTEPKIKDLKTREKGDLVMVGSNRTTPSSDTSATKGRQPSYHISPVT